MATTKAKKRYRLTNAGDYMSTIERLMVENVIAWRIIALFGLSIAFCNWLESKFVDAGLSAGEAEISVFLILNVTFFATCSRYWDRSIFPLAPRGWRRGTRARIAIAALVFHFSLLAFAPLHIQLAVALGVAWYKFNFIDLKR